MAQVESNFRRVVSSNMDSSQKPFFYHPSSKTGYKIQQICSSRIVVHNCRIVSSERDGRNWLSFFWLSIAFDFGFWPTTSFLPTFAFLQNQVFHMGNTLDVFRRTRKKRSWGLRPCRKNSSQRIYINIWCMSHSVTYNGIFMQFRSVNINRQELDSVSFKATCSSLVETVN